MHLPSSIPATAGWALLAGLLVCGSPGRLVAQPAAVTRSDVGPVPEVAGPDSTDNPASSKAPAPAASTGDDGGRLFTPPLADPRQPRVSGAMVSTNLFRPNPAPLERPPFSFQNPDAERREYQSEVAIGSDVRLVHWTPHPGVRAALGIEGGVFARFRMETRTNDLVGTDWIASLPFTVKWGSLSGRLRLLHWSSHLGDEVELQTGAQRITYGYEATDLLLSWQTSPWLRLYGGSGVDLRSAIQTDGALDERAGRGASLHGGVEVVRRPFDDGRLRWVSAVDWKSSHARRWRSQWNLVTGLERLRGDTRLRLLAGAYFGPSELGEFFLTDERAYSLELSVIP